MAAQAQAAARDAAIKAEPYFTGDGGKGKRIAILVPEYMGPQEAGVNLPAVVQSAFITDFNKYSALRVLDRETLNRLLQETLDPTYKDNLAIIRLGHITQTDYIMTADIIKTGAGGTASRAGRVLNRQSNAGTDRSRDDPPVSGGGFLLRAVPA